MTAFGANNGNTQVYIRRHCHIGRIVTKSLSLRWTCNLQGTIAVHGHLGRPQCFESRIDVTDVSLLCWAAQHCRAAHDSQRLRQQTRSGAQACLLLTVPLRQPLVVSYRA